MIDVPDLRIGNWVYDGNHTQFPMWVCSVQHDGYVTLDFKANEGMPWDANAKDLEGIPLTDELLRKIGFYRNELWWRKLEEGYAVDVSVGLAYAQVEKWDGGRVHSSCTCHGVRFVHELQNLFWNITKQQLTINL